VRAKLTLVDKLYCLFHFVKDQYICKVAKNAQDAMQLITLGFEYVTGEYDDGGKLFKKKKLLYLNSQNLEG
jgi:hypothetical protein